MTLLKKQWVRSPKFFGLLILTILVLPSYTQEKVVNKIVLSAQDSTPIPYVNVYVAKTGIGTYTDVNGVFHLSCQENDSITLSTVGYQKTSISANLKQDTIFIEVDIYSLDEVVVSSKPSKPLHSELGFFKRKNDGSFIGSNSVAVLIDNPTKLSGQITKVFITLSKTKSVYRKKKPEFHDVLVRLKLLTNNFGAIAPENNLLTNDVLFRVEEKDKKITVDITNNYVSIPKEGVFIAIEFVGYYANNDFIPFNSSDKEKRVQFKAVFSDGHSRAQSWLKYDHREKWELFNLGVTPHKNFNFGLEIEY